MDIKSVPPHRTSLSLLRRALPAAVAALALSGCEPSMAKGSSSATLDYVVFDPSTSRIPLPNDLALQQAAATAPKNPQQALLQQFAAQGGFPADQDLPITIDLEHTVIAADGTSKTAPQAVDASTLGPATLLVLETDLATGASAPGPALEPGYQAGSDRGTLVLHNPSGRWKANHRYVVILRGGPAGARLVGGGELTAMPALFLLTQGVVNGQELLDAPLTLPQNQYLLPGDTRDARAQAGAQLELLRQAYLPLFGLVDATWGRGAAQQIVSIQTFTIAPPGGAPTAAPPAAAP